MRVRPLVVRPLVVRTLVAFVLAGAGACTDPLAPEAVAGVYVRGPGGYSYGPDDAASRVVADTIFLHAGGSGVRRTYLERPTMGPLPTIEMQALDFAYTVDGREVSVAYRCPDVCALVARPPVRFDLWGGVLISHGEPRVAFERRGSATLFAERF